MLVCTGGFVAVVIGQIPLFSEKYPVLTGWQSRVYGLLLFVQLPAAIWIVVARPELKWGAVIAVNATALVTGGPLFVMVHHVKKRNQSMPPNRQEKI